MNRNRLLLLTGALLIVLVSSLLIWHNNQTQIPLKYEKNISRVADNSTEEEALATAESLNYSFIVSKERFSGSTDPNSYLNPGTYLSYTSANFIDSQVIQYYTTRYNNLQGKGRPKQIEFLYEANATKRTEFQIYNSPAPEGANWHNTTIVISAPDGSLIRKDSTHLQVYYKNQSNYQTIEWDYSFDFSDCHVIEMKLAYSEVYASVAGFFVNIYQIVVFDKELTPVLIGIQSSMAVA